MTFVALLQRFRHIFLILFCSSSFSFSSAMCVEFSSFLCYFILSVFFILPHIFPPHLPSCLIPSHFLAIVSPTGSHLIFPSSFCHLRSSSILLKFIHIFSSHLSHVPFSSSLLIFPSNLFSRRCISFRSPHFPALPPPSSRYLSSPLILHQGDWLLLHVSFRF